ncbi:MAG: hypothetical protein ACHWZW_07040 [Spirulina sp.]
MDKVIIGICGGFHAPQATEGIFDLWAKDPMLRAIPAMVLGRDGGWAPLSAHALRRSLDQAIHPAMNLAPPSTYSPPRRSPSTDAARTSRNNALGQGGRDPRTSTPTAGEGQVDLILWAFSAGCVGAVALAHHWHRYRGNVRALFLVDGWGVPWHGVAPLHRISHDGFTHHSSRWLGAGRADFVAQPAVPHLQLWRSPQTVMGLGQRPPLAATVASSQPWSAADFLIQWTQFYALPPLAPARTLD